MFRTIRNVKAFSLGREADKIERKEPKAKFWTSNTGQTYVKIVDLWAGLPLLVLLTDPQTRQRFRWNEGVGATEWSRWCT